MVFRSNNREYSLHKDFKWSKLLAIVSIIGTVWIVSALILSTHLFSNVQAQEYTPVLRWGKFGISDGGFKSPEGIAVDQSSGNVFVADTANNRIQVISRPIS